MQGKFIKYNNPYFLSGLLFVLVAGSLGYSVYRDINLSEQIASQKTERDTLQSENESRLAVLEETLKIAREENLNLSYQLDEERERRNSVEDRVENITGTVGTLEKLSKTDPELLQKYSKVFFLNEHYVPTTLTTIPDHYIINANNRDKQIHTNVWTYLKRMIDAADVNGTPIRVISAYRSFDEQEYLKIGYTVTYGVGTSNQFSADQGYSEHQLGTTVDLTTVALDTNFNQFDQTQAYQWLLTNAHKYGFTLSYPANNQFYQFEPWHWRFVGVALATKLRNEGKHFYDLDQRVIDGYLADIFE